MTNFKWMNLCCLVSVFDYDLAVLYRNLMMIFDVLYPFDDDLWCFVSKFGDLWCLVSKFGDLCCLVSEFYDESVLSYIWNLMMNLCCLVKEFLWWIFAVLNWNLMVIFDVLYRSLMMNLCCFVLEFDDEFLMFCLGN